MYDEALDCWVFVTAIPNHVRGLVRESADGTVIMLINEALSDERKKETYEHEKRHIQQGDLHSDGDLAVIEGIRF